MRKRKIKIGDFVRMRQDDGKRYWVTNKAGKLCLKMMAAGGWVYFEPKNWDDIIRVDMKSSS
jgi:hypothetical protein